MNLGSLKVKFQVIINNSFPEQAQVYHLSLVNNVHILG